MKTLKKIINYFINIYIYIFSFKIFYYVHYFLIHLSMRSIGYKNFGNMKLTGENYFLRVINKHNVKMSLDIGANVGNFSKQILLLTNSKVISIEPMLHSFEKLKEMASQFDKRIICFNIALSNNNKKKKIYFQSSKSELASFQENIKKLNYINKKKIKYKLINSTTLDAFVKQNMPLFKEGIDFIKIDTEGHDHNILAGSKNTIKKFKPKFIQFEMNWHYLFEETNIYSICSKLNEYNLFRILPYESGLIQVDINHPNNNFFYLSNYVLIRADISIK